MAILTVGLLVLACGDSRSIEEICEDECNQQVDCYGAMPNEGCVDNCVTQDEAQQENTEPGCHRAMRGHKSCRTQLSCDELNDQDPDCQGAQQRIIEACGDGEEEGGQEGPNPGGATEG